MTEFIEKVENGELGGRKTTLRETHIATAKVGKDTIEAEYFIFDHSDWFGLNEPNWTLWDRITTPFWKAKRWIKDTYWEVRYGFQRMFNGYDSVDTFETFWKFINRYSKILIDYRNNHWGYPGDMTVEEWDAIVDEMIYHLKYMDEETVTAELERDVPDNWTASHKTVWEILDKHKNRFFELFSKYFYHLWD
jgi:hypothetical protein